MARIILAVKTLPEAKQAMKDVRTASVQPNEIALTSFKTESGLQNSFASSFLTRTHDLLARGSAAVQG